MTRFARLGTVPLPVEISPCPASRDVDQSVVALHDVAYRIDAAAPGADAALRNLLGRLQAHPDPGGVGLLFFAAALARRMAAALGGQLADKAHQYLRRFDLPQHEMFKLLWHTVPFDLATCIANSAIAWAVSGLAHPKVIDVGIGTGRQLAVLLQSLAVEGRLPKSFTIVGIAPLGWALAQARAQLTEAATRLGTAIHFVGVEGRVESLSAADWHRVAAACTGRPVVNTAFALHRVADDAQGRDQRNAVLRRLHALNPQLLVLTEPDVDHLEPRFLQRFRNCHAHFSAMFKTLDALPMAQTEHDALKVGAFGREIADILATPDGHRSVRHETAVSWFHRLAATGFAPVMAGALPASPHPAVKVVQRGQRVALQADSEPMLSLLLAPPLDSTGR